METETDRTLKYSTEMTLKDLTPNVAALLCYVAGWISGIVFLVLERKNRLVRFHAYQSIIVFGALTVAGSILGNLPLLGLGLGITLAVLGFALWLVLIIKANEGSFFKLPWAGNLAEKLVLESVQVEPTDSKSLAENIPESAPTGQTSSEAALDTAAAPTRQYPSSGKKSFRDSYYSYGARTARIVGSSFAIAWCAVLLVFFNFFNQYIAYYQPTYAGGLTHWQIDSVLNQDFSNWLPILNATLALSILAHAIAIVYDKYLLRQSLRLVINILGLAAVISLLVIFPFNFNVIPNADASYWAPIGLSLTLILIAVGMGIGIVVRFIQVIVHAVEGKY